MTKFSRFIRFRGTFLVLPCIAGIDSEVPEDESAD